MNTLSIENAPAAVGRIPSGLFIVTTGSPESGTGFLASFIQQVSLDPLIISICVGADRPIVEKIKSNKNFAVHVLAKEHNAIMKHFARGVPDDKPAFEGLRISKGSLGTTILEDCLAAIECEVLPNAVQPGDHVVFYGKVVGGLKHSEEHPFFHVRKDGRKY